MAAAITTFREFFTQNPDPYGTLDGLMNAFSATDPNITPGVAYGYALSHQYPVFFVGAHQDHNPMLLGVPFMPPVLPGAPGAGNKLVLTGDMSPAGQLPQITTLEQQHFHLVNANGVPPNGEMNAAWAAHAGVAQLPSAIVNNATAAAVTIRRVCPVPHPYVAVMIEAADSGVLTWRWLWANVATPIINDPNHLAAYGTFLDYIRVNSVMRPGTNAPDPDRPPTAEFNFVFAAPSAAARDQFMVLIGTHLPGRQQPTGYAAQIQMVANQNMALQQAVAASVPPAPTLQSKKPLLFGQLQRLCETANEADFAPDWDSHVSLKSGAWLSGMEAAMMIVSNNESVAAPIIDVALATDIGLGRFVAQRADQVTEGLSIFRIRAHNHPERAAMLNRNRTYTALAAGTANNTGQMDAQALSLSNNEISPPQTSEEFRAVINGYRVLLLTFCGEQTTLVQAYTTGLIDNLNQLVSDLEGAFLDESRRRHVFLLIMMYIHRVTNAHIEGIMRAAVPTPAVLNNRHGPDFDEINR